MNSAELNFLRECPDGEVGLRFLAGKAKGHTNAFDIYRSGWHPERCFASFFVSRYSNPAIPVSTAVYETAMDFVMGKISISGLRNKRVVAGEILEFYVEPQSRLIVDMQPPATIQGGQNEFYGETPPEGLWLMIQQGCFDAACIDALIDHCESAWLSRLYVLSNGRVKFVFANCQPNAPSILLTTNGQFYQSMKRFAQANDRHLHHSRHDRLGAILSCADHACMLSFCQIPGWPAYS